MGFQIIFTLLLIAVSLEAQRVELSKTLQSIAARAAEKVEVDLDEAMLNFAAKVLSDSNPEEATAKRIIAGLKEIHVRVLTFAGDGAFSSADLQPIREQLQGVPWIRFVSTSAVVNAKKLPKPDGPPKRRPDSNAAASPNDREEIEVWMYREFSDNARKSRGVIQGERDSGVTAMLVLSSSSRQITVVNIVGAIRPEDFVALGGRFGIPKIDLLLRKQEQQ